MLRGKKDIPVKEAEDQGSHLRDKDYERIGRGIEEVVSTGYFNKRRIFWHNLLRGIAFGIGSAIGATLIIAVTLYALSLFSELPWIGDLFESLESTLKRANNGSPTN